MINLKPIFYFSVMTSNRGDIAIRKSITDAISKRINIPFALFNVKDKLTKERIIKQLNIDGSALIIAGSGLYSNTNTKSGWYFNCETELLSKINKPIFLIGLGCNNNLGKDIFGGELSNKAKQSIKLINKYSYISTVRDQRTYNILKDIGINNHTSMLDPACFLEVSKKNKEKRVAINLAQHAPALGRFDGGIEGQKQRQKNIDLFTKVCDYLINKQYELVFIAHDALEQSLYIDLKKKISSLQCINTDNIDDITSEYSRCMFSIGMKMHSNILSFASGTPFISLYYDYKSIEYLKMIQHEPYGASIYDVNYDWLKDKIDSMIDFNEYFISKTIYKKEKEQIKFNKLMDKLCNIIKTTN